MLKFEDFKIQFKIDTPKCSLFYVYTLERMPNDSQVSRLNLISISEKDFYKYKILDEETKERFPTVQFSGVSKPDIFYSFKKYFIDQC